MFSSKSDERQLFERAWRSFSDFLVELMTILSSAAAQPHQSNPRTRLEACVEPEWRQQPREEGDACRPGFIAYTLVTWLLPLPPSQLFISDLPAQCFVGGAKRAVPLAAQVPPPVGPAQNKGPYEHYHAALDQMAKPQPKGREGSSPAPGSPLR